MTFYNFLLLNKYDDMAFPLLSEEDLCKKNGTARQSDFAEN